MKWPTIICNALTLPGDLIWIDEFQWNPVERATEYAVTGALVVDVGERLAGRPITLEHGRRRLGVAHDAAGALRDGRRSAT